MRTTFAIFIVSFIALASSCVYSPPKEPVDYVNPNIGTIGFTIGGCTGSLMKFG